MIDYLNIYQRTSTSVYETDLWEVKCHINLVGMRNKSCMGAYDFIWLPFAEPYTGSWRHCVKSVMNIILTDRVTINTLEFFGVKWNINNALTILSEMTLRAIPV